MASDITLKLLPGYRFRPSDSDLLQLYLRRKLLPGSPQPPVALPELDFNGPLPPWDLIDPASCRAHNNLKEWFCFAPLINSTTWIPREGPTQVFSYRSDDWVPVGHKRVYAFVGPPSYTGEGEWLVEELTLPEAETPHSMAVCKVVNKLPERKLPDHPLPPLPLDAPFPEELQRLLKNWPPENSPLHSGPDCSK